MRSPRLLGGIVRQRWRIYCTELRGKGSGGKGGIRTLGGAFDTPHPLSRRALSATQPPPRGGGVEYTHALRARTAAAGRLRAARSDAGVVDRSGLENRKGRQALGGSTPTRSATCKGFPALRGLRNFVRSRTPYYSALLSNSRGRPESATRSARKAHRHSGVRNAHSANQTSVRSQLRMRGPTVQPGRRKPDCLHASPSRRPFAEVTDPRACRVTCRPAPPEFEHSRHATP